MKSRTCPHCGKAILVGEAKFDDKLNLVCTYCAKIIVPVECAPLISSAVPIRRHYDAYPGMVPGFAMHAAENENYENYD